MTQTLHLDKITNPPITSPIRVAGRWLKGGAGPVAPAGGDTWYNGPQGTPNRDMPFQVQLDAALDNGWNCIPRIWAVSSRNWAGSPWTPMPWLYTNGRYDLNNFDPSYFMELETRLQLCLDNNLIVGVIALEGHFDLPSCPLTAGMNHQGIDGGAHPFSQPTPEGWVKIRQYLVHLAQVVKRYPNAFVEVMNEGEWDTGFQRSCVDALHGEGVLVVASSHINGPSPEALKATGADMVAISWNSSGGELFGWEMGYPVTEAAIAESAEATRPYSPEIHPFAQIAAGDHNDVALSTRNANVMYSLGWSSFCRGLMYDQMAVYEGFQLEGWIGKNWNDPSNPAQRAGRRVAGQINAWSQRIRLGRMRPEIVGTGFALVADDGKEHLLWSWDGEPFTLDLPAGVHKLEYFNPKTNKITSGMVVQGGAGKRIIPQGPATVVYLYQGDSAFPEDWLTGGGTEPPPPPPPGNGDGTGRARQAGKRIDNWMAIPTKRERKQEIQKLKKARADLKVAIRRATD